MDKQTTSKVLSHPKFQTMAKQKSILGWTLSEGGITTWGIYIGLAVIVFAVAITGIYVYVANGRFEETTREVVREVTEGKK